jgi:S1-C subfamily serine protease
MDETTRGRRRPLAGVAALLAAAAIALSACGGAGVRLDKIGAPASPTVSAPSLPSASPLDPSALANDRTVQVVRRVAPAVVNVTTRVNTGAGNFIGGGATGRAVGTGFIIRSDGVVVTNFHVVESALSIRVTLPPPDGRSFSARVIGGDSDHDLAILKMDGTDLPTMPLGSSSSVQLGEPVIALGYALALPGGPTVTSGIISALARTVQAQDPNGNGGAGVTRTYQDALQTDAAINPGNSGGPLVDLAGNVIGINTAGSQQAENIGFSIAIDAARPIIERAMSHPSEALAYLGVSTQTVDAGVAGQFELHVSHGALVLSLAPGGPAQKAGIQAGDVITGFEEETIDSSDDLGAAILARKPGDRVSVEVVHQSGSRETIAVTLGVKPLPTP